MGLELGKRSSKWREQSLPQAAWRFRTQTWLCLSSASTSLNPATPYGFNERICKKLRGIAKKRSGSAAPGRACDLRSAALLAACRRALTLTHAPIHPEGRNGHPAASARHLWRDVARRRDGRRSVADDARRGLQTRPGAGPARHSRIWLEAAP